MLKILRREGCSCCERKLASLVELFTPLPREKRRKLKIMVGCNDILIHTIFTHSRRTIIISTRYAATQKQEKQKHFWASQRMSSERIYFCTFPRTLPTCALRRKALIFPLSFSHSTSFANVRRKEGNKSGWFGGREGEKKEM